MAFSICLLSQIFFFLFFFLGCPCIELFRYHPIFFKQLPDIEGVRNHFYKVLLLAETFLAKTTRRVHQKSDINWVSASWVPYTKGNKSYLSKNHINILYVLNLASITFAVRSIPKIFPIADIIFLNLSFNLRCKAPRNRTN